MGINIRDVLFCTIIECIAMTVFVWFGVGSAVSTNTATQVFLNATAGESLALLPFTDRVLHISLAFGFGLAAMVAASANTSGGHLNPAVTLGLVVTGNCEWYRGIFYIAGQCLGAVIGAALVYAMVPLAAQEAMSAGAGANGLGAGVTEGGAFVAEVVGTFALMFTVLNVAGLKSDPKHGTYNLGKHAAWLIGVVVAAAHMVMIPIDGCSINPARTFGASLVTGNFDVHYIFWLGPFVGALFAAGFYMLLVYVPYRKMDIREEEKLDDIENQMRETHNSTPSEEEPAQPAPRTRRRRRAQPVPSSSDEEEETPAPAPAPAPKRKRRRKKPVKTPSSSSTSTDEEEKPSTDDEHQSSSFYDSTD